MTTTLNSRCSGAWRNADGVPVTIVSVTGRAATVELGADHAGYKAGKHLTLPAAWVTDDAPPALPAATVEIDAAPPAAVCPACGRRLP